MSIAVDSITTYNIIANVYIYVAVFCVYMCDVGMCWAVDDAEIIRRLWVYRLASGRSPVRDPAHWLVDAGGGRR